MLRESVETIAAQQSITIVKKESDLFEIVSGGVIPFQLASDLNGQQVSHIVTAFLTDGLRKEIKDLNELLGALEKAARKLESNL